MGREAIAAFLRRVDARLLGSSLARFFAGARKAPFCVSLDISSRCNIRCRTCSLEKWYPVHGHRDIDEALVAGLARTLRGTKVLFLQCNCEPLLNRDVANIIRQFKKENPNLHVLFATNGTLLTPALSAQLITSGLDEIYFSIDGATPETHDAIRSGSSLTRITEAIKDLRRQKEAKGSATPKIGILTVSSRQNVRELASIPALARELGAETLTINGLEPYDEEAAGQVLWGETADIETARVFAELEERAKENGISLNIPSLRVQPGRGCLQLGCVIDTAGEVYPCSSLSYERPFFYLGEKLMHPRVSFGNIRESGLGDIWNSRAYRTFRKKVMTNAPPACCAKCPVRRRVITP